MNNNVLVSIIMTFYNMENTIYDAVKSIVNQEHRNFELILVDDCSTDNSVRVVKEFLKKDNRLKLCATPRNSRSGPIEWEPRNNGLQYANGELIAYLDADNTWKSSFLTNLTGAFSDPNVQLAYCNSINHYPKGMAKTIIEQGIRNHNKKSDSTAIYKVSEINLDELGFEQYIDTNEIMHRSSIFNKIGYLWSTFHPNKDLISSKQSPKVEGRRHNDLELVLRVINIYGVESIKHINLNLVDYYYKGSKRRKIGYKVL